MFAMLSMARIARQRHAASGSSLRHAAMQAAPCEACVGEKRSSMRYGGEAVSCDYGRTCLQPLKEVKIGVFYCLDAFLVEASNHVQV